MLPCVKTACLAMFCGLAVLQNPSYAAPASDNAGNVAYADGWQDSDNGGTGFMPWILLYSGLPLQPPEPHFIDTEPPLAGNTLGSPAFGLTTSARPGWADTSEAIRTFATPLAIGETLLIDIDGSALNPGVARFTAGNVVQLFGANNIERFSIFTNNGYERDNWVATGETNSGVPAGNAFRFEFRLESADTYDFFIRPLGGGDPLFSQNDATLDGTPGAAINRLRLATYGNGSSVEGEFELFFNNVQVIEAPANTWNIDSDGNWSSTANWTIGVPNIAGAAAVFSDIITAPRTVTVESPITVGHIGFENTNAYTIAGSNTVNFDATSGVAQINVTSGSHTISAPLTLADNTVVNVLPATGNLSITGALSSNIGVSLTKAGAGTLIVNHVRATALSVNGGAVAIAPDGSNPGTSIVDSLDIDPGTRLDLNNNDLVVRATAETKDAVHADIEADIVSAQNGLDAALITKWDGPGITSSTARAGNLAQGFDLTGLGVIRNADLDVTTGIPNSTYTSFSGQAVTPDDVLVKYTYVGDANLSGAVSFDDYVGMDNAFFELIPNLGWATGDINFDGLINFDDYSKVDQAFFFQGAPLSHTNVSAVPEPSGWALVILACFGVIAMHRIASRRSNAVCTHGGTFRRNSG